MSRRLPFPGEGLAGVRKTPARHERHERRLAR
jgi:hypothetical protein